MTSGFPDWTKAIALLGWDGTQFIPVLLDEDGNLNVLMRGEDGTGTLRTVAVDASGQIVTILRGSDGNYVSVDASGFLTTVLKGAYGATLKTIAVDVDGKLNAFIYDTEDAWGRTSTVGLSEMAARLGSPITFDRSGQIVLMETFEQGAQRWALTTSGTGASIVLSPAYSCAGGYSLKFTGGSTFAYAAMALFKMGVLPIGRMGFAFSFSTPGNFDRIECTMYLYTGTVVYSVIWKYKDTNDKIYVVNSAAAEVEVGALSIAPREAGVFNVTKLIVDLTTGKYVKLLVNATEFDISTISMYSGASATAPHIYWAVSLYSRDGQNDVCYLDNVFITSAEPE